MKLVIFRHAERDNLASHNPSLSSRGIKQSHLLSQFVENEKLTKPNKLFCSPKLRTIQTFQNLHETQKIELEVLFELDERSNSEKSEQFTKRVRQTLKQISSLQGVIFLCSHLDWIEEALIHIASDSDLLDYRYQNWRPGSFMVFDTTDELWHLEKWEGLEL